MDFKDCDYSVQQVHARTRQEKFESMDRDTIEKTRLASRHENFERHQIADNIIKPMQNTSYSIDDVDRFNRDHCADQKKQKEFDYQRTLARAAYRRQQQEDYAKSIDLRREEEAYFDKKILDMSAQHDFNVESVLYDPVTNGPPNDPQRGETLKTLDATREVRRAARANRIYHQTNSVDYDPITGEPRKHW